MSTEKLMRLMAHPFTLGCVAVTFVLASVWSATG